MSFRQFGNLAASCLVGVLVCAPAPGAEVDHWVLKNDYQQAFEIKVKHLNGGQEAIYTVKAGHKVSIPLPYNDPHQVWFRPKGEKGWSPSKKGVLLHNEAGQEDKTLSDYITPRKKGNETVYEVMEEAFEIQDDGR